MLGTQGPQRQSAWSPPSSLSLTLTRSQSSSSCGSFLVLGSSSPPYFPTLAHTLTSLPHPPLPTLSRSFVVIFAQTLTLVHVSHVYHSGGSDSLGQLGGRKRLRLPIAPNLSSTSPADRPSRRPNLFGKQHLSTCRHGGRDTEQQRQHAASLLTAHDELEVPFASTPQFHRTLPTPIVTC